MVNTDSTQSWKEDEGQSYATSSEKQVEVLDRYEQFARASSVALVVKNPPANTGDSRTMGLIPGSGRSPGKGHGNPLQDSCLENPIDGGAWQVTVHGVAKSRTGLSDFTFTFTFLILGQYYQGQSQSFSNACLPFNRGTGKEIFTQMIKI